MMNPSFLSGKKVLVTRGEQDHQQLSEGISAAGGIPVTIPLIDFQATKLSPLEKKCLATLSSYDWVIFTSKNGVDHLFQQTKVIKMPKIPVNGEKTKGRLKDYGYTPSFQPSKFVAECFVEEFLPILREASRVLIVKGNLARSLITNSIKNGGHHCDDIIIYKTIMPKESETELYRLMKEQCVDIITFTSSSTVHHFMKVMDKHNLRECLSDSIIACIGPIAEKTAKQYGLNVQICADPFTVEGLVKKLVIFEG